MPQEFVSVHAGHVQIEQDDVRSFPVGVSSLFAQVLQQIPLAGPRKVRRRLYIDGLEFDALLEQEHAEPPGG